jgi:membrane-associated HD superfamily phosphohydrolase
LWQKYVFFLVMNSKKVLNGAALVLGLLGVYFKVQWWAGADVLILLGFAMLLVSVLGFTARANAEVGTSGALNYVMVATLVVGIMGVVFKFLHWPGHGVFITASTGLLLVLALMLIAAKKMVFSDQFVTVLAVFSCLVIALFSTTSIRRGPAQAEPLALEMPLSEPELE